MASGQTLVAFTALQQTITSSTNPASAVRGSRNGHPIAKFHNAIQRRAYFEDVMPRHYSGGSLKVTLAWASAGDTDQTKRVRWAVAFERMGANDIDIDAADFAAAKTIDVPPPATASGRVSYTTLTFTQAEADGVAAGDAFRIYVDRLADAVEDTSGAEANLLAVEIQEA